MALQTLDPIERLRQKQQSQFFESDTTSGAIASEYSNLQKRQADMLAAIQRAAQAEQPQEDTTGEIDFQGRKYTYDDMSSMPAEQSARIIESAQQQGSILPGWARVTQAFGNVNPRVEVFNKSGVNTGTDFGIKEGTPLALPPGEWEVLEAYSSAKGKGFIGNKANRGYGNSVLVKNSQTGETMRFSHLSGVNVQPGKIYKGGTVLGASGATGNVTGPHLDLEYKTAAGKYQDVLRSQYAKSLFGQGGGSESYGMGGGVSNMLGDIKSKAEKAISDYVARNKEMANRYGEMEAANYNMASAPILPNVKWQEIAALMEKNNVPGRTIVSAFGEMQAKDPLWNIQQKMRTGQPISDQERKILNESAMMTVGGSTGSLAGSVKDAALVKKVINNEKQITSIINRASDQKLMSDPIAGGQNIEDAEKAWKAIFGKQKMPLSFDETVGRLNEALEGAKTQTLMQREATRIPDIDLTTKVGDDSLLQEARKYSTGNNEYYIVHNTEKAPKAGAGDQFGQNIEPAGKYVNLLSPNRAEQQAKYFRDNNIKNMVVEKVQFKNPLIIDASNLTSKEWKTKLSKEFGGLTGKDLSKELANKGFDGIITMDNGHPSESIHFDRLLNKATDVTQSLLDEARKYKSAEEFVRSQGTPLYHGTNKQFDIFDQRKALTMGEHGENLWGQGFYTTPHKGTASQYGSNIMELYGKPNKILDLSQFKTIKELGDFLNISEDALVIRNGIPTTKVQQASQLSSHAKELGYDAIFSPIGKGELVILDSSLIKTKSQLTDIYNQATQKVKK